MRRKNAGRVIIVRERAGAAHHQSKRHIRSFLSIANEPVGLVSGGAHPSDDSSPWASPLRQPLRNNKQVCNIFDRDDTVSDNAQHSCCKTGAGADAGARLRPVEGSGFFFGSWRTRTRSNGKNVSIAATTTPPTTSSIRGALYSDARPRQESPLEAWCCGQPLAASCGEAKLPRLVVVVSGQPLGCPETLLTKYCI